MHTIRIVDLEVFYRVGVPDEERANPQRLLVTIEMDACTEEVATSDDLADTIDYFSVSQEVMQFGADRSWKLLEKLSADLAKMILEKYLPECVRVEIKKFIIPEARHISVVYTRIREA